MNVFVEKSNLSELFDKKSVAAASAIGRRRRKCVTEIRVLPNCEASRKCLVQWKFVERENDFVVQSVLKIETVGKDATMKWFQRSDRFSDRRFQGSVVEGRWIRVFVLEKKEILSIVSFCQRATIRKRVENLSSFGESCSTIERLEFVWNDFQVFILNRSSTTSVSVFGERKENFSSEK